MFEVYMNVRGVEWLVYRGQDITKVAANMAKYTIPFVVTILRCME